MPAFTVWLVIGLVAGFIAHVISHDKGIRYGLDIFLSVAAALMGGWLVELFGAAGRTGLDVYSIGVPLVCSVVLLFLYHTVIRPKLTIPAMETSSTLEWTENSSPTPHAELKETHPRM